VRKDTSDQVATSRVAKQEDVLCRIPSMTASSTAEEVAQCFDGLNELAWMLKTWS
jgi:hypothetical protein